MYLSHISITAYSYVIILSLFELLLSGMGWIRASSGLDKTDGANPSQHPQEGAINQESEIRNALESRDQIKMVPGDGTAMWKMQERQK